MGERFAVLLVQDHRPLAESIGAYLEASGFVVDYAGDGLAALHLAGINPYDAIVLDIGLPGVDGLDVCRSLREVCGNAALYFEPLQPAAITAAIRQFHETPGLPASLAVAGRERLAKHFRTWNQIAIDLLGQLNRISQG